MQASPPALAQPPQYALVAQRLMDDIASGLYPVGSLLPAELDLCTQFGVSRHTMREAIRRLLERGLVTRQRGIGTRVKANRVENKYVQTTAAIEDLSRYVKDTRLVTTQAEDVIADEALATLLKCPPGQRWVKVTGFRHLDKGRPPIALTDIYINAAYGGSRKLIGALKSPVYTLLEKQYGLTIVQVQQEISATIIDPVAAKRLSVKPNSAGLVVMRRYLSDNDHVIEVAVNLHPADRFSYSMSLRLQTPSGIES
ncbi:GntR family transcriptional regulator [Castellaniella sp.]|uniref:GntR family transcriptional regulator n=1 Tax=Castellaniella sp. TaxID=1955812 RepID=UPI003A8FD5F3